MTQKLTNAVLALGLVAIGLFVLLSSGAANDTKAGASINHYEAGIWQFGNGLLAGLSQQFSVDSAGNISTSGTFADNSVTDTYTRMAMVAGTTTICAIQSPAATTTLRNFVATFTIASTSAQTITMAKAANAFATTTNLTGNVAIAASGQATVVASTTIPIAIIAPSQWLVVGQAGGAGGASLNVPIGTCQAVFQSTN